MPSPQLLYLSKADAAATGLTMAEVIDVVEMAFAEMGAGRVDMPPKIAIHPGGGDNFIHAMPAAIDGLESAGLKWVGGFLENPARGLPYISGLVVLNDTTTGLPVCVMDCVWLTGMRTGAASAVSAKYLARSDAKTIGVLGCGVQGHTNLEAMTVPFGLTHACLYDKSKQQAATLADFARHLGLKAIVVDEPRQAVSGCDIVVTAGPMRVTPHATIQAGWLEPGAFASCVDYDSYWSRAALAEADKWTTDNRAQYEYCREHVGYFQDCPPVHAELGELVTGKLPGRERDDEITMAANLGLAMTDMAVAPLIFERAREKGLGTWLPL